MILIIERRKVSKVVKCPECNHIFQIGSFICPKKVAITKREKISSLTKQITKNTPRGEKFKKVSEVIHENFLNREITAKAIMQMMGWSDHSDGDVTLTFLDALICRGILKKTRHKKGRGGHLYKLSDNPIEECPYFTNGECNCDINLYTHIEEEEEI